MFVHSVKNKYVTLIFYKTDMSVDLKFLIDFNVLLEVVNYTREQIFVAKQ